MWYRQEVCALALLDAPASGISGRIRIDAMPAGKAGVAMAEGLVVAEMAAMAEEVTVVGSASPAWLALAGLPRSF
jgi:hypothetical protein